MSTSSTDRRRDAFAAMLHAALPAARHDALLRRAPAGWLGRISSDRILSEQSETRPVLRQLLDDELEHAEQQHDQQGAGPTGVPVGMSDSGRYWIRRRWLERAERRRNLLGTAPQPWARLALLGVVAARELCCDLGAQAAAIAVGTSVQRGANSGFSANAAERIRAQMPAETDGGTRSLGPAVRWTIAAWTTQPADEDLLRHIGTRCLATSWAHLAQRERKALLGVLDEHFARSSMLESAITAEPFTVEDDTRGAIDRWFVNALAVRGPRT